MTSINELEITQIDAGKLPSPNVNIEIEGLSSCTDSPGKSIHFNSDDPITVLVHGCRGSAGRFGALAQLYAFHGQQAVCFSYDERDSLVRSANHLVEAVGELSKHTKNKNISVLGHSMGGLVARKAMSKYDDQVELPKDVQLTLITVSAPIAGIAAASHCGSRLWHWGTFGVVPLICYTISGDHWWEITDGSDFIQKPGMLRPEVSKYLKVVTNEVNSCRAYNEDGSCLESDHVFELTEQYMQSIDAYPNITNVEVRSGHVAIVGYKDHPPITLLSVLQDYGVLAEISDNLQASLDALLGDLY